MNWSDEEIDGIFREANLSSNVPEYKDTYFDEIEYLLPKKSNKKLIFWSLSSVIVVLLTALFFLSNRVTIQSKNIKQVLNQADISENKKIEISPIETKGVGVNDINKSEKKQSNFAEKNKANNTYSTREEFYSNISENSDLIDSKNVLLNSTNFDQKKTSSLFIVNEIFPIEKNLWNEFENDFTTDSKLYAHSDEWSEIDELEKLQVPIFEQNEISKEILPLVFPIKIDRFSLYGELGMGFSESFTKLLKSENIASTNEVYKTFHFGTGVSMKQNKNRYQFGVNYMLYSISDLDLNRNSIVFGFDINRYSQNINYKSLSVLEFPVLIERKIKNQYLGFGLMPTFCLGSKIHFTKSQNDIEIVNETVNFNKLGIVDFGLKPQISYSFQLTNGFEIGTKLSVNLINHFNKINFENSLNSIPVQMQVSFKKYIKL